MRRHEGKLDTASPAFEFDLIDDGSARLRHIAAILLLLVTSCGSEAPGEGTSQESNQQREWVNYRVVIPFRACPEPSDFHAQVDAILAASPKVDLPARCKVLPAGMKISLAEPGHRPTVVYRQFEFESGTLETGETVWSNRFYKPQIMEDRA